MAVSMNELFSPCDFHDEEFKFSCAHAMLYRAPISQPPVLSRRANDACLRDKWVDVAANGGIVPAPRCPLYSLVGGTKGRVEASR